MLYPGYLGTMLLTMLLIGVLTFKRLPIYGIDPDPYNLSIYCINLIAIFHMIFSFFSIPVTFLLTLHFIINKIKLTRKEKISLFLSILSIGIFFAGKYFLSF